MAKRFEDTMKYRKSFIRSLPGAYKILWDYLCCECDHSGIWYVDFEVAQIYVGKDMPIEKDRALELFNADEERIYTFDRGKKWFIKPFVDFQYGRLNPSVKAHASVIHILQKEGVWELLANPLQRVKDKDKDTDTDMDKAKEGGTGGDSVSAPVDNSATPPAPRRVDAIAQEKSAVAYREFRAALDSHVRDGTRLGFEDPITRDIYRYDLGGLDAINTLIAKNGNGLELAFRSHYEQREKAEYARNRSG